MKHRNSRTASFARGFFQFLTNRKISAAVLHGGEDGFERNLSDIDFVVERKAFRGLPSLIDEYSSKCGWRLCQVLRHETTASYHVCSASDDPSCVVALDACSDYQRNGTVFLTAEELLKSLQPLGWGAHGLFPANKLCYRFAKAAAKNKDAVEAAEEFGSYPPDIRQNCAIRMHQLWGVSPTSWDVSGLTPALAKLRAKSNSRPTLMQAGALARILSRILRPSGLVVIAGHLDFNAIASRLECVFGPLYFRRFVRSRYWHPAMYEDLIASTLIIIPKLEGAWSKAIPKDCIHRLKPAQDSEAQCRDLARHLHERCARRENLPPPPSQS